MPAAPPQGMPQPSMPPQSAPRPSAPPTPGPRPSGAPMPGAPRPQPAPGQGLPPQPAPRPSAPPSPAPAPARPPAAPPVPVKPSAPTPAGLPAAGEAGKRPINPFLANDPNAKAKRLARALVSDMVTYMPQKREEGLRNGTLKQLFKEEIKKSYEEYVEQIGKEFAESTSHFQDALNDVLGGGQKLF